MKTFKELELLIIKKRLISYRGNVVQTAKSLGLNRNTVLKKVKEHNINLNVIRKESLKGYYTRKYKQKIDNLKRKTLLNISKTCKVSMSTALKIRKVLKND